MKRLFVLAFLFPLFLLQSCGDFLDIKPENVRVVNTVEDYRDLLAGYMKLLKTVNSSQASLLSGSGRPLFNVSSIFICRTGEAELSKSNSGYYDATLGEYTTGAVDELTWMGSANNCWNQYYTFIGLMNMIADGITTAEGQDERLRDYVRGEALVWRAYSYFKLLQYFSPYKNNEYGIPVYLKPYEDPGKAMPERKKQTEVYNQILDDCREILALLERTPSTTWNYAYEPRFVHGMLAAIYHYKAMSAAAQDGDWQKAAEHATQALNGRSFVRDQDTYTAIFDATALQAFTHDEFYFRLVDGSNGLIADFSNVYYSSSLLPKYEAGPKPEFYALYREDDVRKKTFFRTKTDGSIIYDKYNISANPKANRPLTTRLGGVIMLYRAAEIQLIKAEALCRLGKNDESKAALDEFKKGRYLNVAESYTESDLLNEILKERKLEFYHEQDMWWLDMKRLGIRMERVINGTLYVLEPDDYRYAFPIPSSEIEVNKNMVQNPGWDEINL